MGVKYVPVFLGMVARLRESCRWTVLHSEAVGEWQGKQPAASAVGAVPNSRKCRWLPGLLAKTSLPWGILLFFFKWHILTSPTSFQVHWICILKLLVCSF